jgi:hypothetical protein
MLPCFVTIPLRPASGKIPSLPGPGKGTPGTKLPPAPSAEDLAKYEKLCTAIAEEPGVVGHRLLLADICLRLGRKQEAKAVLVKAMEREPASRPAALAILRGFLSEREMANLPIVEASIPFWEDAARVLSYPLAGNGPVLLIGGAIVFAILGLLVKTASIYFWLPMVLGAGYLASYMMTIIENSARAQRTPPDYPDFANFWDSILGPFWIAVCSCLIPMALPIAYVLLFGPNLGVLLTLPVGLAYLPMALIAGAIFQSAWQPLNVPLIIRAIRVTAREYFPAVLAIYGLTFVNGIASVLAEAALPGALAALAVEGIGLYFLMVEMDILGRIYFNHSRKIGWFDSPRDF